MILTFFEEAEAEMDEFYYEIYLENVFSFFKLFGTNFASKFQLGVTFIDFISQRFLVQI